MPTFTDRREAGRRLAAALAPLAAEVPVVVGLPRGGVPVAAEVARALGAPLDVIVVRKLGVPTQPELGMGAVGEDGVCVRTDAVADAVGVAADAFAAVRRREQAEVEARARRFRAVRPAVPLAGRTVIVVDDGLATGGTARAAVAVARARGARRVVLAVPVAAPGSLAALRDEADAADAVVCLAAPPAFVAVGQWYGDFTPTTDADVVRLLADPGPGTTASVVVPGVGAGLAGELAVPPTPAGVVVFAHGSGSGRHSPRNRHVADALGAAGFATLRVDLEAPDGPAPFDAARLGRHLLMVTDWVRDRLPGLPVGWFGASTGAAVALWAAAEPGAPVGAVVARGGRPDLVRDRLGRVRAPTLLIVGGADPEVLAWNQDAARRLTADHDLAVVPGAGHLFSEPGALDAVARLATGWFADRLGGAAR